MKNNKHWFKAKKFGWGYVPCSWEGWIMILLMIGLTMISVYLNDINQEVVSTKNSLSFLFDVILIILVTIPVHHKKSKDKLKWRWGN